MTKPREERQPLIQRLIDLRLPATEYGVISYLINFAVIEGNPLFITKARIKEEAGVSYEMLQKTVLPTLEETWELIEVQERGQKGMLIYIKRTEEWDPPADLKEKMDAKKTKGGSLQHWEKVKNDPTQWNCNDVAYYWSEIWQAMFGEPYRMDFRKVGSVIKKGAMEKLDLDGPKLKGLIDYLLIQKKGILPNGQKVFSLSALGSESFVNQMLDDMQGVKPKKYQEESKEVREFRKKREEERKRQAGNW